jgi:endonuclease/exonuclease/phosphatase (EEP) superfamily protein YafD
MTIRVDRQAEPGGVEGAASAVSGTAADQAPSFATTIVNRRARAIQRTIKTVLFNARSGARFEGILASLRRPPLAGADVIILCEADWRTRRSFNREVAAELAAALELSFVYGPEFAIRRASRTTPSFFGNAILSSTPLRDASMIPMSYSGRNRRNLARVGQPRALVATATFADRPVTIAVAHLDSRWDPDGRRRQMKPVIERLRQPDLAGPMILAGDFNTTTTELETPAAFAMIAAQIAMRPSRFRYPERYEPLFEDLADAGFKIEGANAPGKPTFTFSRAIPRWLRPKLDWIALRGLEPVPGSARVIPARPSFFGRRVSDHDFVMCEVRL